VVVTVSDALFALLWLVALVVLVFLLFWAESLGDPAFIFTLVVIALLDIGWVWRSLRAVAVVVAITLTVPLFMFETYLAATTAAPFSKAEVTGLI
jgi:hypothetical protein